MIAADDISSLGVDSQGSMAHVITSEPPLLSRASSDDQQPSSNMAQDALEMRTKRIACELCRKRKLKCDGIRSGCSTCIKLTRTCCYNEVRRKSGPKRGYVKTLEARIAQMETRLKPPAKSDPDVVHGMQPPALASSNVPQHQQLATDDFRLDDDLMQAISSLPELPFEPPQTTYGLDLGQFSTSTTQPQMSAGPSPAANPRDPAFYGNFASDTIYSKPPNLNQLISLGIEEAMPDRAVIDDLTQLFFGRVHPSYPILHRARFQASMGLSAQFRPPVCLQYAIWTLAASVTDGYEDIHQHFYQRARKYAERDEMHDNGTTMMTVAHAQTWVFLSIYEFQMTFFPRAWMSIGRAVRLAAALGLGSGRTGPMPCFTGLGDWIEQEQRRRTFWLIFCQDRGACVGSGWDYAINEDDIEIHLPVSESAFQSGLATTSVTLREALRPGGASNISAFGGVVVTAALMGRIVPHVHRPVPEGEERILNSATWKRHRAIDKCILDISMALPSDLRMPNGMDDVSVIFMTLSLHTATILLHKAAIIRAETVGLSSSMCSESKLRCIAAAKEIASTMRIVSHRETHNTNIFTTFTLYMAATVFIQYLRAQPADEQIKDSLHFVLSMMQNMGKHSMMTDTFLAQLDSDFDKAGFQPREAVRVRWRSLTMMKMKAACDDPADHGILKSRRYDLFGEGPPRQQGRRGTATSTDQITTQSRSATGSISAPSPVDTARVHGESHWAGASPGNNDQTDQSTTSLHQISSHASTSSNTPPSSTHDDACTDHANYAAVHRLGTSSSGMAQQQYDSGLSKCSSHDKNDEAIGGGSTQDFDQIGVLYMSDSDWKQVMDVSVVDMGWNASVEDDVAG